MSKRRTAYVMEQTLGNVTHYKNLRREEDAAGDVRPCWLPIEYQASRAPWTITGSLLARRALTPVLGEVGGIFMHTSTLALMTVDCLRRKPTVMSCDGTPHNKRDMREAYGLKPESGVANRAKRALYRQIFSSTVGLVGWSTWTKESFVHDYGCREEDVAVIPPGIDLEQFAAGDRDHELPRLLFVGGDFARKGGTLLLDVFRRRLRGRAELILVTREDLPEEPGITVHRNIQVNSPVLRQLYATSDVFVLPTLADCFPLVSMEALASGLPLVASNVGGIADAVRDGQTGYLVEPGNADALGDALETLIDDPRLRRAIGRMARAHAEQRFCARTNARRLFEFVHARCGAA